MTFAEEIIRESIKNEKLSKARGRRREVEKLLNYYTGTNTERYIERYFDAEIYQDVPIYKINVTRKFIDKMSRIYVSNPIRRLHGEENELYTKLTPKKNLAMKQVERMTNLTGTPALRVLFNNSDEDNPQFTHNLIYYYEPHFGSDPTTPIAVTHPVLSSTGDIQRVDELQYEYWDESVHIRYSEEGNVLLEEVNPYGVLPFRFPRDMEQIDDFINEGATDVIAVNEQINITMTNLQLGLHYQMLGQPYATGVYSDTPIQRVGVDTIINVPEGGTFGIASPQGDLNGVINTVKFQLELLAQSRHMNITFDSNSDRPSSGLALMIKDYEHIADYYDDVERYRFLESDIYELEQIEAKVNGYNLPDKSKFSVEFTEVEYPSTANEQIAQELHDLERGYITDAEILQRRKGDVTLSQAQEMLDKNKVE